MIYLDYNATTPVDPAVREVMLPFFGPLFGNPSSIHEAGIIARRTVGEARHFVASLLGAFDDEIIFTGGGSESNNMAIKGIAFANRHKGNHLITTAIEHPAVLEVCSYLERSGFRITRVPVDSMGIADPEEIRRALTPSSILVSVMHANNETGSVQPVETIGRIAREHGVIFHCDAAQTPGKIAVKVNELNVDLLSLAGHKFYAPKGIGVLYIRRGVKPEKLIHGADHEMNLRAGTENVPGIAGIGKAASLIQDAVVPMIPGTLRDRLQEELLERFPELKVNGHPVERLPNTLSLGFPDVEAGVLLREMKGLAASAGAACHSGSAEISGVLGAMQVPLKYAMGTIRFSTGRYTTLEELNDAVKIVDRAYRGMRKQGELFSLGMLAETPGDIRLTSFTRSLGCACKIRPQHLEKIIQALPPTDDKRLLVGTATSDDAAVYLLNDQQAIVQTVDFIPPLVDDPYTFGSIAAANALSDIYAMGGTPLFALNIVAFPEQTLPPAVLTEILRGAADKSAEAGITIGGGHSIDDPEPKFGMTVTGLVDPNRILRNSEARPGDHLILTKPLGTGILTTAIKRGFASRKATEMAIQSMTMLNRLAAEVMAGFKVHACTDVTGFGLLGHLREMVNGAGLRVILDAEKIPLIEQVWDCAAAGMIPGGTRNNLDFVEPMVTWDDHIPELMKIIMADAQTSGGLLFAVAEEETTAALDALKRAGIQDAACIGQFTEGSPAITVLWNPTS